MIIDIIIPSAGSGRRMNADQNKLFLPISGGESILAHSVRAFAIREDVNKIIIPCKEEEKEKIQELLSPLLSLKEILLVKGGETRTQSVRNALIKTESDIVLIHDGARPFVSQDVIDRVIAGTIELGAVIPTIPLSDTVKDCENGEVTFTLPRERLALVQTPQGFNTKKLKFAYESLKENKTYTDDATVYEQIDKVHIVEGDKNNIKITTPEDLPRSYVSGVGFDAHRFVSGRPLFLGGIEIPHDKGLLGHSDADVVLHALMDALLSAIHNRDIGYHFPCTEEFRDADSKDLLKRVLAMLQDKNVEIVNASIVIVAEKPKLSPHVRNIEKSIANLLSIADTAVSITATTTEKLGFTGREEGIACEAVVSVRI